MIEQDGWAKNLPFLNRVRSLLKVDFESNTRERIRFVRMIEGVRVVKTDYISLFYYPAKFLQLLDVKDQMI